MGFRHDKPVGWAKQAWREAAAHHRAGRRASAIKMGSGIAGPHSVSMFLIERYAALAFFAVTVRCWPGLSFAAVFFAACAFSLAAKSCLTLVVIAATSTL